ncbi:WD repeat-containing protein 18 isoform X4 [Lagenorhynchus albirostris]|uniref:WD repeat-containing protein 18 isoform X4 n=1 Tax=Lagenorhynchus albirostris TaxID=27610 RepID=UPI0028EDEAC4|nr:WD repeat-containing protein 18 isoform X4 [Lagenorhynchus albirostris]
MTHVLGGGESMMAAPVEVAVCTDSAAQLWSCVVWELHSGANLLTYRGGQAGPRGLALLNGPASAEDHVPRTGHLSYHVAQWPLRSGRDHREHIPVGGFHGEPSGHPEPPLPGCVVPTVHGGQQPLRLGGQGLPGAGLEPLQLWEVSSGELLLSVLFDVSIMAVTMDLAEHHMFCGGSDGSIFQVDLCTWPGQREKSFQPEQDHGKVFRGHRNQVTCLSVSTDGSVLLSGSHDETVRLWDVQSQQCLRTVALKGPVTNACIVLAPVSMLSSDCRPSLPLPHFNKHLLGAEHGDEPRHGGLTLRLGLHQQAPGAPPCLSSARPALPTEARLCLLSLRLGVTRACGAVHTPPGGLMDGCARLRAAGPGQRAQTGSSERRMASGRQQGPSSHRAAEPSQGWRR